MNKAISTSIVPLANTSEPDGIDPVIFENWHQSLNEMETLYLASRHPESSLKADSIVQAHDHLREYKAWFYEQGRGE